MRSGNGRYLVIASGLAIVVTAIVQTIFTTVTGVAMSSTIPGMLVSVVLFGVIMFGVLGYFGKKVNTNVDEMISLYDDACDPQAFSIAAQPYAESVPMPYDQRTSWFMSYFAQALLDLGEVQKAQRIEQNMYESIRMTQSVDVQAQIIVNLVPLINKVLGPADAIPVIQKGLELLESGQTVQNAHEYEAYLRNQMTIAQALVESEDDTLARFYKAARTNPTVPLRVRVEQAWDEAKICYRAGEAERERECLEFIVENGNNLALVKPAKDRLASLSQAL